MSHHAPHILLLDEPTNHLDLEAKEGLIRALNQYSGAVIIVSHDTHLISHVVDRLWLVKNGTCKPYEGDVESYRKSVLEEKRRSKNAPGETEASPASVGMPGVVAASKKKSSGQKKKAGNPANLAKIEAEMTRLSGEKQAIETALIAASHAGNSGLIEQHSAALREVTGRFEALEAEWIALSS